MTSSTVRHRGAGPRYAAPVRPAAGTPTPLYLGRGRYASTHHITMRHVFPRVVLAVLALALVFLALGMAGRDDMRRECLDAHTFGNIADAATLTTCADEFGPRGY